MDQNPGINIVKEAAAGQIADEAGEFIDYNITVENTGNQTLTGITVSDPFAATGNSVSDPFGIDNATSPPTLTITSAPTGTVMTRIVEELVARDHEVHVVTLRESDEAPGVQIHQVSVPSFPKVLRYQRFAERSQRVLEGLEHGDATILVRVRRIAVVGSDEVRTEAGVLVLRPVGGRRRDDAAGRRQRGHEGAARGRGVERRNV